jgi:hypothetical protein
MIKGVAEVTLVLDPMILRSAKSSLHHLQPASMLAAQMIAA